MGKESSRNLSNLYLSECKACFQRKGKLKSTWPLCSDKREHSESFPKPLMKVSETCEDILSLSTQSGLPSQETRVDTQRGKAVEELGGWGGEERRHPWVSPGKRSPKLIFK